MKIQLGTRKQEVRSSKANLQCAMLDKKLFYELRFPHYSLRFRPKRVFVYF